MAFAVIIFLGIYGLVESEAPIQTESIPAASKEVYSYADNMENKCLAWSEYDPEMNAWRWKSANAVESGQGGFFPSRDETVENCLATFQVSPDYQQAASAQDISPNPDFRQSFETTKATGQFKYGAELNCFPSSAYGCTENGCTHQQPGSYYFVDHGTESGSYFRCDSAGCDQYSVDMVVSGAFTQFAPKKASAAMLFKVSSLDNSFIDVATIGTGAIVSYGKCE